MTAEELSAVRARANALSIVTRKNVDSALSGNYRSAVLGRGVEFAELREYEPGDDVRSIDWNVTARAGRPFVKRFVEERELAVLIVLDVSASHGFGSASVMKSQVAAETAGTIAAAAIANTDRAGLMTFASQVDRYVPPAKGTRHLSRILRTIIEPARESGAADAREPARMLARVFKRRSVMFVISDFLSEHGPGAFIDALLPLTRLHDVIAVRISDPRERELPRAGLVELEDPETGRTWLVDLSDTRTREQYRTQSESEARDLTSAAARAGISLVTIETTQEPAAELNRFLSGRRRAR